MRLFRFRGADIVCSPLLLLALPAAFMLGRGWQTVTVFASLSLHEAAHAAAAKRAGCTVTSIEAQPFGFVARLSCASCDPHDTAAVFAAGPIASLSLAAAAALMAMYLPGIIKAAGEAGVDPNGISRFLRGLSSKNLLIASVNMLPALPLDGGRLIAALVSASARLPQKRSPAGLAVRLLSASGVAIGAAFAAATPLLYLNGVFNPTFSVMGVFLILAAVKELRLYGASPRHKRLSTRDVIAVRPIAVGQDVTIASAMRMLPAGAYALVSVLDASHRVIGTIDESRLAEAAAALGASASVRKRPAGLSGVFLPVRWPRPWPGPARG